MNCNGNFQLKYSLTLWKVSTNLQYSHIKILKHIRSHLTIRKLCFWNFFKLFFFNKYILNPRAFKNVKKWWIENLYHLLTGNETIFAIPICAIVEGLRDVHFLGKWWVEHLLRKQNFIFDSRGITNWATSREDTI